MNDDKSMQRKPQRYSTAVVVKGRNTFKMYEHLLGTWRLAWPILDIAARIENPNRAESPKKTTALSRTQTVCMLLAVFQL